MATPSQKNLVRAEAYLMEFCSCGLKLACKCHDVVALAAMLDMAEARGRQAMREAMDALEELEADT